MKKINLVLFALIMIFMLVGCNEGYSANDEAFKKCLSETKPLNSETLDSLFSESLNEPLPDDLFTGLTIDNTKVAIEANGVQNDFYLWQEESKIHLNAEVEGENQAQFANGNYYIDLAQLESMYDEYISAIPTNVSLKPSELYETIITEYGHQLGLTGTIFAERTLDELLDIFNYSYNDFVKVEDGKYKLKNEAFLTKLLKWSIDEMTLEDLLKMMTENNIEINIYVYFDGTRINAYEVILNSLETGEIKVKLSLYGGELIQGLKIEAYISGYEISLVMKTVEEKFTLEFIINVPGTQKMTVNLTIDSKEMHLEVKNNDIQLYVIHLNYDVKQEGNTISFGLSGCINAPEDGILIMISSGDDVVIPNTALENKDQAINLLEQQPAE